MIFLADFNEYLYDHIGNRYDRKNIYLKEVSELQKKIRDGGEGSGEASQKLQNLKKNKNKHLYNIKLKEYKNNERSFLKAIEAKRRTYLDSLKIGKSHKLNKFRSQLFVSKTMSGFYKEFKDLSYDAQMKYKQHEEYKKHLPEIIEFIELEQADLERAKEEAKKIDKSVDVQASKEFIEFKEKEKKILNKEIDKLKRMKAEGAISKKAKKNAVIQLKQKYKKSLELKRMEAPSKANKEYISSKTFEIKHLVKTKEKVLNAEISEIRRKTPVEINKSMPIMTYLTALLPGLGQILNKQYIKGGLFLLVSFFTYLIAFPYAILGKGNFQGQGIKGLITLAEGGARIDKSLIYMIEGVVGVILLLAALILMIASFKDVYKVEKNNIKGIRPNRWFETKENLSQEGFPYLVSLPALLLILFVIIVPVTTTFLLSMTNMDPNHQSKFQWVFLENYKRIALGEGLAGSVFWLIFVWTIIWTILATSLAIFIGFGLALLVNNPRVKAKGFFRTVYILPWAVPAFITIMFFSIMLAPNGGITDILVNLFGQRIEVKNDPLLTRIGLIMIQGWLGSAYIFLLSTGVLQSIPGDLYEAADIDGASSWQKLRKITVPMVLFQISPLLVTQYTFNFNNFSVIFLFNEGGPFNPNKFGNLAGSSDILISYIYKLTMDNKYQAIGAAITIFISLALMVFAYLGFRNSKGFKEEKL